MEFNNEFRTDRKDVLEAMLESERLENGSNNKK